MLRKDILRDLNKQLSESRHIIGTVAGSGMTARYTAMGGSDLIFALSAGRVRFMGRSSFTSFFCYANSNDMVMDLGMKELLPLIKGLPIIFGLNACDPFINLYDYIRTIKNNGFSGIVNFPTVCLIDGQFREALEEEGNSFDKEVEAISLAHYMDLFTIGFVHDEEQARLMTEAGADIICVHFGFTKGGHMGAKRYLSIENAREMSKQIFEICDAIRPDVIKMVYGGPANTPEDMQYIYNTTLCQGYIGGSTFDRIPTEKAILETTRAFKSTETPQNSVMNCLSQSQDDKGGNVDFVKSYIAANYMLPDLRLADLALIAHVSSSYLSTKFKQKTGSSFTDYLIKYRMEKAVEIMSESDKSLSEIAADVGYTDYPQFSKMFKKHLGTSPSKYEKQNINTN
ncbi:MAG: phosphoenolpyruvate hydrolase family protein [Oscillospiraceae bacterium]